MLEWLGQRAVENMVPFAIHLEFWGNVLITIFTRTKKEFSKIHILKSGNTEKRGFRIYINIVINHRNTRFVPFWEIILCISNSERVFFNILNIFIL